MVKNRTIYYPQTRHWQEHLLRSPCLGDCQVVYVDGKIVIFARIFFYGNPSNHVKRKILGVLVSHAEDF